MGNINRIDLSKLKSHKSTFNALEKSFNNSAYSTFNSSYIKRCSDPYVTKMKSNLTLLYNQIKKGYSNIDSWWTKYNQNAEGLEKKLSNEGNTITEYGIRAYATHLPELNDFKIPTTVSYASGGIPGALSGGLFANLGTVSVNADPFAAIYSDYNIQNNIKEMVSDTNTKQDKEEAARMVGQGIAVSLTQALSPSLSSFLTTEQPKSILDHALDFLGDRAEDVGNFINDVGAQVGGAVTGIMDGVGSAVELIGEGILRDINNTFEFLNRTAATIATFGTSAIKGIGRVFEGVVDFMYSARSVIGTPITWLGDLITGGKYNFTEQLHEQTQAIISVDITESVASAIGNTGVGKAAGNWMKENAVFYDQVSALGEGVGEVVGILGISALTMGTVNPAIVAGAVGYGKGVQTAYQNGASYGEGVLSGVVTGGLDATTYYLGGKVGGAFGKAAFAPIAGTGAKVTLGNAGIRVGIDMLLGIGDSLLRPFTQFYQDGYTDPDGNYHSFEGMDVFERYQVMFEQTGGLEGLAVNATLGAGFSTLGEAFDLKRFFGRNTANSSANASNIKVVQTDIRAKMDRYNELLNIKNSDDYLSYMENARKGSVQVLRPEYEGIEQEFLKLKDELTGIISEGALQSVDSNTDTKKENNISDNYKTIIDNSNRNIRTLKEEILSTVTPDMDNIHKMRKLYIELNKRLHYDIDYLYMDNEAKKSVWTRSVTFENLNSDKVICRGWSELYRDLLLSSGFSPQNVEMAGYDIIGNHKWIEVDFGDYIVIADGTDAIKGTLDLANCKAGLKTKGFQVLPKEFSGTRLSKLDLDDTYYDLKSLDIDLGYASKSGYLAENIEKAKKLFNVLKTSFNRRVNNLLEIDIPKNMNGHEAYPYYKQISEAMFTEEELKNISPKLYTRNVGDSLEGVAIVGIKLSDSQSTYLIYSESTGKKIFDNAQEFQAYANSLNLN